MKNLLILGAGTAGTMMANHLRKQINLNQWAISIVDEEPQHYYQPGFLFMPFGIYKPSDVVQPKKKFVGKGVEYIQASIDRVDGDNNKVLLQNGNELPYDILIIATGCHPAPEEVEGLTGPGWGKNVHEFYTFDGSSKLAEAMKHFNGGKLVVHIAELPIKCPVAPLEFAFLADWWLGQKGLRNKTEITYVTPLSSAFTKPTASKMLSHMLEDKNIRVVTDFNISQVDHDSKRMLSWGDESVDYDLLVTVPTNMGSEMVDRSGLGDELNFIPTDAHTLQSKAHSNIFVLGDATDLPTSKAGSVAHFEADILTQNILSYMRDEALSARFDGHANCFVESGYNKAILLDFNYEQEPVPGTFPLPGIGPMKLLRESRLNHIGKMAFRWVYWNVLLHARPMPGISPHMTKLGKEIPKNTVQPNAA